MRFTFEYKKEGKIWADEVEKKEIGEGRYQANIDQHRHSSYKIYISHRLRMAGIELTDLREYLDNISSDIEGDCNNNSDEDFDGLFTRTLMRAVDRSRRNGHGKDEFVQEIIDGLSNQLVGRGEATSHYYVKLLDEYMKKCGSILKYDREKIGSMLRIAYENKRMIDFFDRELKKSGRSEIEREILLIKKREFESCGCGKGMDLLDQSS